MVENMEIISNRILLKKSHLV